jgi:putative zinc finger/helix-turn-helix YgiT family protein
MTEKLPCPHCELDRDVELVERDDHVKIKGRDVAFKSHLYRCTTCGNEFEMPGQLDANLDAAREAYARMYEAPTPEQLVAIRSRYGASQKAFGMILGFGELTMNSYEQGAAPDSTNRLLLKLADNPVFFKAMYDINSMRIGALQRQRIESSEAYRSVESWKGMEALAATLTQVQRQKVEACAEQNKKTILQQVSSYVSSVSFQDYSNLALSAKWTGGGANTVINQTSTSPAVPLQAAS